MFIVIIGIMPTFVEDQIMIAMNNEILTFAAVAGTLALGPVSCSDRVTEVTTYENNYEQTLVQDDSASVRISHSIEYYKSLKGSKALRGKINDAIVRCCFGEEYAGLTVEEASDAVSDTLIAGYQKDAGQSYEEYLAYSKDNGDDDYWNPATFCNWYYRTSGGFGEEFMNLLTYQVLSESYTGGAHGMYYSIPYIIDMTTGEIVTENDLFLPGYVAPVTGLIKAKIKHEQGGDSFEGMFQEGMVPNGKCGVSIEGVTWFYQPYEVASYAEGIIKVTISWTDLKPYLNPEYIKL